MENRDFNIPYIEDPSDLGLKIDELSFVDIDNIEVIEDFKGSVYDLEIDNLHNYQTELGIVHNGGGRRKGSISVYLEPWHADIFPFLDLRKNNGKEELRARDLFLALWIPDLFMKRVKDNGTWTLMCPHECPGLAEVYGQDFEDLYTKYETEGKGRITVKAQDLWFKILESQYETGTPYILFKDACNSKSNQKHLGTIKGSNLCAEIIEYVAPDEVAVCNLASIAVNMFVEKGKVNYKKLEETAYQTTLNLNKVIDRNYYPVPEAKNSNLKHRPIGLGIQGLANLFAELKLEFTSDKAKEINKLIFETIYYGSMRASIDLAEKDGYYLSFPGSPLSEGKFQFDLWGQKPDSDRYNWDELRERVIIFGARNSLLIALMPTASCLLSSSKIKTSNGILSYQDIMNENNIDWRSIEQTNDQRWISFKEPIKVMTRHGEKEADKIFYNGHVETLDIEMEDGKIFTCSYNHKFLVKRDNEELWIEAENLREDDNIVTF